MEGLWRQRVTDEAGMTDRGPRRTSEIARDLRAYASAGMEPAYASKLLAAAAELDALAAHWADAKVA